MKDNCGNSVSGGTMAATFSNGDPPLALTLLHTGIWSATWAPRRSSPGVTITLLAQNTPAPNLPVLKGSVSIAGSLTANVETPVIDSGGILNAASYAEGTAAPGAYIVIFGSNLAT